MLAYIIRRVLLIVPTLFGIMLLNFAFIQFAPGGPVEQVQVNLLHERVIVMHGRPGGDGDDTAGAGEGGIGRIGGGERPAACRSQCGGEGAAAGTDSFCCRRGSRGS